jgi:beta-phosphoglucomutase-like phosphatase (HAD superfamily)
MIKAFIFDMDGLLVETESVHIAAFERFMRERGISIPDGYVRSFVGFSIRHNVERMQREMGLQGDIDALARERNRLYLEMLTAEPRAPLPGVAEAFRFAETNRLKKAVCSTSVREQLDAVLPRLLTALGIRTDAYEWFDSTISGSDISVPKPAPDIYLECARRLQLEPAECLAFEDSMAGAKSATAAGMPLVVVPNEFCPRDAVWPTPYVCKSLKVVFCEGLVAASADGVRITG